MDAPAQRAGHAGALKIGQGLDEVVVSRPHSNLAVRRVAAVNPEFQRGQGAALVGGEPLQVAERRPGRGAAAHGKILVTLEDPFPAYAYGEPGG
jgi:hypothetical protein